MLLVTFCVFHIVILMYISNVSLSEFVYHFLIFSSPFVNSFDFNNLMNVIGSLAYHCHCNLLSSVRCNAVLYRPYNYLLSTAKPFQLLPLRSGLH